MSSSRAHVAGTPRWAVVSAWVAVLSVVPSGLWRILVGVGVDLGWSQAHLDLERIPGWGTVYVLTLTVVSIGAASLTLGLVQPWGEVVPSWVPLLAGRRVPLWFVVTASGLGAVAVARFVVFSIQSWSAVSGFADQPGSPWAVLMAACYLPVVLWAPCLLACLAAYVVRRRGSP